MRSASPRPLVENKFTKIKISCSQSRWQWGCGCIGYGDKKSKSAQSWNQHQTLTDYLCYHMYCAQPGAPWGKIAGASCAVSNRESRYPPYREKPRRCSNLVENMLTQFFEAPTPGKNVGKTRPFREIHVMRKGKGSEEARPGGSVVKRRPKTSPANI